MTCAAMGPASGAWLPPRGQGEPRANPALSWTCPPRELFLVDIEGPALREESGGKTPSDWCCHLFFLFRNDVRRISNRGCWQYHLDRLGVLDRGWRGLRPLRMALVPGTARPLVLDRDPPGCRQESSRTWGPVCPCPDRPGEHGGADSPRKSRQGPTGHRDAGWEACSPSQRDVERPLFPWEEMGGLQPAPRGCVKLPLFWDIEELDSLTSLVRQD